MSHIGLHSGIKIYVDNRDQRGKILLETDGNFNPNSVNIWNLVLSLRSWPMVIDVGANYGEMLAWGQVDDSSQVFAFEPNPQVIPLLKKTISTLPFGVTLFEEAVSNKPCALIDFVIDQEWSGTSKLSEISLKDSINSRYQKVAVPCTSIDARFGDKLHDGFAMKIDVEGSEIKVLQGASKAMKEACEWIVMLEILHMSFYDITRLAQRKNLFLYNLESSSFVRAPTFNVFKLWKMLHHPKFYRQDAVIASSKELLEQFSHH